ncbi:hypothetical protein AWB81_05937 [Caballeronia arationis]|uniref:hypothetical protein n=1 Tax=Caballeronia arationis TaxID=1777142 RepID=UPI00074BDA8B|nr:hypothetical protein [Caballeronia arationis]SAL00777.1 hypothetical protein AWB81_05937 [Caballeronia arationis]
MVLLFVLFRFRVFQVSDTFDDTWAYTLAVTLAGTSSIAGLRVVTFKARERFRGHADALGIATTDPLTGILNRRAIGVEIDAQWKTALRTRKSPSLRLP